MLGQYYSPGPPPEGHNKKFKDIAKGIIQDGYDATIHKDDCLFVHRYKDDDAAWIGAHTFSGCKSGSGLYEGNDNNFHLNAIREGAGWMCGKVIGK